MTYGTSQNELGVFEDEASAKGYSSRCSIGGCKIKDEAQWQEEDEAQWQEDEAQWQKDVTPVFSSSGFKGGSENEERNDDAEPNNEIPSSRLKGGSPGQYSPHNPMLAQKTDFSDYKNGFTASRPVMNEKDFDRFIKPILNKYCMDCHGKGSQDSLFEELGIPKERFVNTKTYTKYLMEVEQLENAKIKLKQNVAKKLLQERMNDPPEIIRPYSSLEKKNSKGIKNKQEKELEFWKNQSEAKRTQSSEKGRPSGPPPTYSETQREQKCKQVKKEERYQPGPTWTELEERKQREQQAMEKKLQIEAQKHTKQYIESAKKINSQSQNEQPSASSYNQSTRSRKEPGHYSISVEELHARQQKERYLNEGQSYKTSADNLRCSKESQILLEEQRTKERAHGKYPYETSEEMYERFKRQEMASDTAAGTLVKYGDRRRPPTKMDEFLATKEIAMFRSMFLILIIVMLQGAKTLGIV